MSPAYRHERLRERLGMLVSEIVLGLAIPCMLAGQTTFRRKGRRGGVEGDLSYYLANAIRVRGKEQIDLRVDPPPDLAIKVVHTHDATAAIEVYRRLAVPEVWVCDGEDIQILVRQHDGRFARSDQSAALPFLSGAEILGWVLRSTSDFDTEWGLEVRRWVQETLAPRHRARNPETTESR
jgi:Uma2 family endonuclease